MSVLPKVFENTAITYAAASLDELWHEAEGLGNISVDKIMLSPCYRVRIMFTRKSGTMVWAEGKNTNIAFAMADAINEAREMGAE